MNSIATFAKPLTVVLALCVAAGWASPLAARDRSPELQQLVDRVHRQLELVARFDLPLSHARYEALEQALEAWRQSSRGEAEFDAMQAWLRQALRVSMPGSKQAMPPLPKFRPPRVPETPASASVGSDVPPVAQAGPANRPAPTFGTDRGESVAAAERRSQAPQQGTKPPAAPLSRANTAPANPEVAAGPWAGNPAARPLRIAESDPFVDDPAEPRVVVSQAPARDERISLRPTTFASLAAPPGVNVAELSARIAGYERGLKRVEARLVANRSLDGTNLLMLARELQQLASQREFIVLHMESLDEASRRHLMLPVGIDATKSLLTKQLTSAPESSNDDDVFLPRVDEARQAARELLESL